MRIEVLKFIWQDVGVRYEIELTSAKAFLHFDIVEAETIFSGDFMTLRKVIDSLKFVETFV